MSFACISIGVFVFFLFTYMNLFHIKDVNILSLLFIDYVCGGEIPPVTLFAIILLLGADNLFYSVRSAVHDHFVHEVVFNV